MGSVTIIEDRPAADGFAAARKNMVDSQLRPSGVNDRAVLKRMAVVPREKFVPAEARAIAYMDRAVPLGGGRWLGAPLFHGKMLEEAQPRGDEEVLVVDGGSGYLPELIRPFVASVATMTPAEALSGGAVKARYALLLVDGAIEQVPPALAALLADGGRMLTGIMDDGITRLALGRPSGDGIALLPLAEIGIPLLPEFARPKAWAF